MTVAKMISVWGLKMAPKLLADWQVWRMTVARMIYVCSLKITQKHLADWQFGE
jgi:hypothetical protein